MLDRKSDNGKRAEATPLPADLVSELLMGMRLVGLSYRRIQITPPFGLRFGAVEGRAQFHFIARGPVFLRCADGTINPLSTGDAVLLPRGGTHDIVSQPDLPCRHVTALESVPICRSVDAIQACGDSACDPAGVLIFSGCM